MSNEINVAKQYDQVPAAIQLAYTGQLWIVFSAAIFATLMGFGVMIQMTNPPVHDIVLNQENATQAYFITAAVLWTGGFWMLSSTSASNRGLRVLVIVSLVGCIMFRYLNYM